MNNNLTNLLPQNRQNILRWNYFLRLSVVATTLIVLLSVISAILLIPTYIFLDTSIKTKEEQLTNIESSISSSEESILSERIASLSRDSADIIALADNTYVTKIIREMLAVPSPGISLSGFSYSPASSKNPKTLSISGSSATRDSLRNYQLVLQSASFAKSANLPISAYAKDTDIDFTIVVTLTP